MQTSQNSKRSRRWVITAVALTTTLFVAVALAGTVWAGETKPSGRKWQKGNAEKRKFATREFVFKRQLNVASGGTFTLEADQGSIELIPSDTSQVSIEAIRSIGEQYVQDADAILKHHEIDVATSGNDVIVKSQIKPLSAARLVEDEVGFDVRKDVNEALKSAVRKRLKNIRFRITVPRQFNAKLKTRGQKIVCGDLDGKIFCETSGGGIKLGKINGSVYASSSGGSLKLEAADGPVELKTSGGSIWTGDISGNAEVATSGGSIQLGRVDGSVSAKTSGGSIRIGDAAGGVEVVTSGGSVAAAISRQPNSDSFFATSGGSVNIALAEGLALDLEHLGAGKASGPFFRNRSVDAQTFKLNGGGPKLTTKGNVRFAYLKRK